MDTVHIAAFSGSYREGSWNRQLVRVAAQGAEQVGAVVSHVNLQQFDLPILNEDTEGRDRERQGTQAYFAYLARHDAFLIASPEYNGGITAALKNAIDWATRAPAHYEGLLKGKVVGLMSTSPGALGGIRGLPYVQQLLMGLGMHVYPELIALPHAHKQFDEEGALTDSIWQHRIERHGQHIVEMHRRLSML